MPKTIFTKPSQLFIVFSVCFSVFTMDLWRNWHSYEDNFRWDVAHYYSYLPAKFCNHNSFKFNTPFDNYLPESPIGKKIPKMTYGMSVMYLPFFAIGYKIAVNQGSATDGFSEPFATCVHWGSIFYGLLGLLLLRNFLVKFYSEWVVTLTLAICFFGTNLFHYILGSSEMTHGYLFCLISAFLLLTWHWHQSPTYKKSLGIGLLIGLISLIRPTEILVALIFIFWNVVSWDQLKERLNFFLRKKLHVMVILSIILLWWTPQLLFWKNMAGAYFFFSYEGERFFWTDPQIVNILFSYRKGWLVYSPLILLAFAGFFFMKGEARKLRSVILMLLALNIYILSCWWNWFYGGGFGGRCFTQHIAFLSLPIAALCDFFLSTVDSRRLVNVLRLAFFAFVFSGISFNLGQSYQYIKLYIHYDAMSKEAYWYLFGNYSPHEAELERLQKMYRHPDKDKLVSGEDRNQ